ncbi:MAG: 4Fe-4S single cluster domain-containing protein [Christensenellales bacterium]
MEIRLAGLEPESIVDGPGYRFTVFVQGCPHNCPGCHNPQTHDFSGGHLADTDDVIAHLGKNPLVRGLTLSGGEPMMQPEPLYLIAKAAKEKGMSVWCYTGFTLEELLRENRADRMRLLSAVEYCWWIRAVPLAMSVALDLLAAAAAKPSGRLTCPRR